MSHPHENTVEQLKSTGTIYWYDLSGNVLEETGLGRDSVAQSRSAGLRHFKPLQEMVCLTRIATQGTRIPQGGTVVATRCEVHSESA